MEIKENSQDLQIIFSPGLGDYLKETCLEFANWVRNKIDFPIPLKIYMKNVYKIKNSITNEYVYATFWAPKSKNDEPYIRIAARISDGSEKFDSVFSILSTFAHELIHYYQWVNDKKLYENEAKKKGAELVEEYVELKTDELTQRIQMLQKNPSEIAFEEIMDIYDRGCLDVRLMVIKALKTYVNNKKTMEFLKKLATDSNAEIRYNAVDSLSYFSDKDLELILIDCLNDPEEMVRINAAQALQDVGGENAIRPLIDALSDNNALVRGYAAVSIGVLGDRTLIKILNDRLQNEHRNAAKLRFYVGLYYLGEKRYFDFILKQLKSRSYLVRMATACYLGDLANEDNTASIVYHLENCLAIESRQEVIDEIKATLNELGTNI
jgi:hypothetical protein